MITEMGRTTQLMRPEKLARLVTLGFSKMSNFRKARMNLLTQYVSRFYGRIETTEMRANPVNLIYQAVTTLVPNLVYREPKAKVSTQFMMYREYASIAELALNHLVCEIDLRMTLRKVITDSIFLAGFLKEGLGVSGQTLDIDGFLHDVGQPYCDRVDPDDMVLDPLARQWEEQRVIGNRFRADLETLQDSGMYDPDQLAKLASRYEQMGMSDEASILSGNTTYGEADSLTKAIDLVELWLPDHDVIVTMPWTLGNEVLPEFLRVVDYEGPERGPYHMLGFAFVPDNIMPVAPAMIWYDLHIMANRISRKLARQAERAKSILAYESSAWQDAQEVVDAEDGQSVRVDNIDAIKEVNFGGTQDDAYRYMEWAKQMFSEMAMNIDLLSGIGSNEATATQAEMVQANSSVRLSDMQGIVYDFTADAMKQLFFFLHTDPLIELPLIKRVQGVDQQVAYTPEMREGDWQDYNIKVRPYSMGRQDPNVKVRRLLELSANVIPALAQAFQLLGPAFNIENALNIIGREMGVEELEEIINSPALHMQIQRMQQMLEMGVPLDQKVIQTLMGNQGFGAGQPMLPGGVRPQQPNPMGMIAAGVSPSVERNRMQQETAGELQATY